MKNSTTTQTNRTQRESIAFLRNHQIEITGDLYITIEDHRNDDLSQELVTFELRDPLFWNPSTQSWTQLTTQSLSVQNPEYELAQSEFFKRLNNYLFRRFHHKPILTIKNTYRQ